MTTHLSDELHPHPWSLYVQLITVGSRRALLIGALKSMSAIFTVLASLLEQPSSPGDGPLRGLN
jgi:hypothetical protein